MTASETILSAVRSATAEDLKEIEAAIAKREGEFDQMAAAHRSEIAAYKAVRDVIAARLGVAAAKPKRPYTRKQDRPPEPATAAARPDPKGEPDEDPEPAAPPRLDAPKPPPGPHANGHANGTTGFQSGAKASFNQIREKRRAMIAAIIHNRGTTTLEIIASEMGIPVQSVKACLDGCEYFERSGGPESPSYRLTKAGKTKYL